MKKIIGTLEPKMAVEVGTPFLPLMCNQARFYESLQAARVYENGRENSNIM
jgi:hypothetical protein